MTKPTINLETITRKRGVSIALGAIVSGPDARRRSPRVSGSHVVTAS